MPLDEFQQLSLEHEALMLTYQEVQARCTQQMQSLHAELQVCRQQLVRLRAQLIARDTALAWEREQSQFLLEEWLTVWQSTEARHTAARHGVLSACPSPDSSDSFDCSEQDRDSDPQYLESSLHAADLVICQTGCISDGDYWRVQNHCKRTGKPCVLVEQPQALRVLQLHSSSEGKIVAAPSRLKHTLPSIEPV